MSVPFEVEELRDHYYLVRSEQDGDPAETRFFADPAALEGLGLGEASAVDVVRATVDYLLKHQRLDDLPTQVDVEDVAAAYDDYAETIRAGLAATG